MLARQQPDTESFRDKLRFLRALLAHPRRIGALAPSSPALARAVAAQIDAAQSGPVLELGPGTGVLTRAILARGVTPDRLIAVEYDPVMARSLMLKFAGVRVLNADAFDLNKALDGHAAQPFAAIVSGIPLLNFPLERRQALLRAAFAMMAPGAPFIQFSYGFHPPVQPLQGVNVDLGAFIWMNLPPAHVWVYRKRRS